MAYVPFTKDEATLALDVCLFSGELRRRAALTGATAVIIEKRVICHVRI